VRSGGPDCDSREAENRHRLYGRQDGHLAVGYHLAGITGKRIIYIRIRVVTVGSHIRYASGRVSLDSRISSFIEAAQARFAEAALASQTTRLAA
jgi:hypothetical protein